MPDLQLKLTTEERQYLVSLLEMVLKEKRLEEHRTRTPSYREGVIQEETVIGSLLGKLGQPAG